MPRTVRLGFVGSGMMGQLAHLACYANLPDVELVALAEGRRELADRVARRYGVGRTVATHRELLDLELDGVVAIMWFNLHYGVVRDLLAAGCQVATEKALAITEPAGQALVAAAAGSTYQVSYMKRYDPGVIWAKQTVADLRASGDLGELRYARIWCSGGDWTAHIEPCLSTGEPVPPYACDPEPPQPGADQETWQYVNSFLNFYSHQTNLLRYLLGEDYEVTHLEHWSGGDVALAVTPSGVRCGLEFAGYTVRGWDEGFELRFANGVLRGRMPAPMARQRSAEIELERAGEQPSVVRPYIPPLWSMARQAEGFVAAIRGEAASLSPAAEAIKEVELAWRLAALR